MDFRLADSASVADSPPHSTHPERNRTEGSVLGAGEESPEGGNGKEYKLAVRRFVRFKKNSVPVCVVKKLAAHVGKNLQSFEHNV